MEKQLVPSTQQNLQAPLSIESGANPFLGPNFTQHPKGPSFEGPFGRMERSKSIVSSGWGGVRLKENFQTSSQ